MGFRVGVSYSILYSQIPFSRNLGFLRNLKRRIPELYIPYIEEDALQEESRETFDSYVYVENNEGTRDVLWGLQKVAPHFTKLGSESGEVLSRMLESCRVRALCDLVVGDLYQINHGVLRGLIVLLESISDAGVARCLYRGLSGVEYLDLDPQQLVVVDSSLPVGVLKGVFEGKVKEVVVPRRALVLDGSNVLFRSMVAYPRQYAGATGKYVGGAFGFYFTLVALKTLYFDAEVHIVFDCSTVIRDSQGVGLNRFPLCGVGGYSDCFLEGYRENWGWVLELSRALGFHVYESCEGGGSALVASVVRELSSVEGFEDVFLYSLEEDFYPLITDKVKVLRPKLKFREHSRVFDLGVVLDWFGVDSLDKVSWVTAVLGDSRRVGVDAWNTKFGVLCSSWSAVEVGSLTAGVDTWEAFKGVCLVTRGLKEFARSGQMDLNFGAMVLGAVGVDIEGARNSFDEGRVLELLREFSFIKEVENWFRTGLILRGSPWMV